MIGIKCTFRVLSTVLVGALCLVSPLTHAQSSTCAANEPQANLSFLAPGNNWAAGTTDYSGVAGTVTVSATVSGGNWLSGYPVSGVVYGNTTDAVTLLVDRSTTGQTNEVIFTFSKPINNLRLLATDLDYYLTGGGSYADQLTVTGTTIDGSSVNPSSMTGDDFYLSASGGNTVFVDDDRVSGDNCNVGSTNCNANFNFNVPLTSITIVYANRTSRATGDPPPQAISIGFRGFCTQNGQALNLAKTWVEATTSHSARATTSSNRVTNASLAAANATFISTATTNTTGTAVRVYPGETITLPAETFGGGATQAMYASTLQCTGGTPLASGSTNRTITIGSTSNAATTCAYTNRGLLTDVSVVKTRTPTGNVAPGNTITYTLTVANNGPATTTGTKVTDTPNAALSCPAATSGPATLTCTGSGCPAAPLYVSTLLNTTTGIVMGTQTAGQSAQLQFSCTVQ